VRHPLVVTLAVLLFAESAVLALATIYLVIEIFTTSTASVPSAVAFTILVAVAAIWVGFIAANVLRGRAWIRGAAITWQVLQVVVAVGCLHAAGRCRDLRPRTAGAVLVPYRPSFLRSAATWPVALTL
jgi:hypothetical protein